MYCKIQSPDSVIFDGEVKMVTLPTEQGEITVLPEHMPLVTVLKPGLIKILPKESNFKSKIKSIQYVFDQKKINLSVSKGLAYIDGKTITVVTSAADATPQQSHDLLLKLKKEAEKKVSEMRARGSIEEIEKSLMSLEKINADIRLVQIKSPVSV